MRIERVLRDKLTKEEWDFNFDQYSLTFKLVEYVILQRPTTRHQFSAKHTGFNRWNGLQPRECTIPKPQVSEELKAEIRTKLIENLKFID